jgi:hypothetical protein
MMRQLILTSGFRPSQPNVAAAAPAAQPNVAAAPKKHSVSKLKKKNRQQKPPQADPNIDESNTEKRTPRLLLLLLLALGLVPPPHVSRIFNLLPRKLTVLRLAGTCGLGCPNVVSLMQPLMQPAATNPTNPPLPPKEDAVHSLSSFHCAIN